MNFIRTFFRRRDVTKREANRRSIGYIVSYARAVPSPFYTCKRFYDLPRFPPLHGATLPRHWRSYFPPPPVTIAAAPRNHATGVFAGPHVFAIIIFAFRFVPQTFRPSWEVSVCRTIPPTPEADSNGQCVRNFPNNMRKFIHGLVTPSEPIALRPGAVPENNKTYEWNGQTVRTNNAVEAFVGRTCRKCVRKTIVFI